MQKTRKKAAQQNRKGLHNNTLLQPDTVEVFMAEPLLSPAKA